MRQLTIKRTLEFYDVPQLFVAVDALNTHYLCVLYSDAEGYEYLGVQLSELRLQAFLAGDVDLREMYEKPETDDSLYHVIVSQKTVQADRILSDADVTAEMLPEPGYYCDPAETLDDSETDDVRIDLPSSDRRMFADISKRMGWVTSLVKSAAQRIAVL